MADGNNEGVAAAVSIDPMLRQFVADRDMPCPACGYNLRDLQTDRCPECGDELQLRIGLAAPRQGALIAGLVGLASGFGLGGLLLIYAFIVIVFKRQGGNNFINWFVTLNAAGCVIHGLAMGLWIRNWQRIRRAKPSTRATLVCVCWLMPFAFIVIFSMSIR